ncbi:protein FAR1-RELATED SEQUENCE 5-like [Juglans regia]|uniref:Protein FAR1-RELATED SEQUENCE n=2 Tax=Juglans regia TaxID=51240 RepID=A0A6P9E0T9_JUGRE|nr:protein FAR1-RELATED SEQUENCE 5-like [Juglans regia]
MEKEKEDASRITVPITNPSIQDNISRPLYPTFSNYMPSYYGPMSHAWLPPFVPPPNANPYPWSNRQHPWSSTAAATSSTTALSSSTALYSSTMPMMGPPPNAYPYPWNNQQHPWISTSTPMSSSASSVSSSVAASSSVQSSASVASSSCSALPAFVPPTSTNPYPCDSEENKVQQSNSIEEISEATSDSIEVEAQSTASLGNTADTKEASTDGGDTTEEPKPRMTFESENKLMNYYKHYEKRCGFGIMTQRSKREKDGTVKYVTVGCARGGKARNRASNVSKPRPTSKTNCKAKMNVMLKDGKLCVTSVFNTHNHGLSPRKSRFFRCNREVNENVKRVLDINDEAGIRMNKSFHALVTEAGGFENVPFGEKDCRNYIDNARHLRLGKGGAQALFEYFRRMQYKNDGFFSLMELDDDDRLKSVFWADARSRWAYNYFGDVVTFDTTYLTNRYGMPFAPFVGVNHHGQSILLGAGLISSEDTESFVWLFKTWLDCMYGKAPNTIITDQDRAMKNAIAIVFPNTRHRYCLWHILRKVPEKLGSHAQYKCGLKSKLLSCVYDSLTIEEFENSWNSLKDTFNLHENAWLQSLYAEREFWVPVYLKNSFWAGMSTTQRRQTFKEFVDQFDNALKKKIENENQADFNSFNFTVPCISHLAFEKKFQDVYTNSKFREVQQEIMGMIYCHCRFEKMDGVIATYSVDDHVKTEDFIKEVTYTLYFNETECEAKCVCGLFEMRGIICRHILAIFSAKKVRELPEKYILDRWRKDIKRKYTFISRSYDIADQRPETVRYKRILKTFNEVVTNAVSCDGHTEEMISKLYAMNEVWCTSNSKDIDSNVGGSTVNAATEGSSKKVLSPHVVRGKGRPPCKRRMSTMEEQLKKIKTKAVNKKKDKGKNTPRRRLDTELLESSGNELGISEMRMQLEMDGTQPEMADGMQPETADGMQPSSFL